MTKTTAGPTARTMKKALDQALQLGDQNTAKRANGIGTKHRATGSITSTSHAKNAANAAVGMA